MSSCTRRLVDFTIISTKNVDLSKASSFQRGKERVKGVDLVHIVIIPLGVPNIKQAIDKAIESTPGAVALVDGVLFQKSWSAFIYGQMMYVVEGTPLIDKSLVKTNSPIPDYSIVRLDKHGNISENKAISKEEYLSYKAKTAKLNSLN